MPFTYEHQNPPPPFNPEFREGLGDAVSKAHQAWCEKNPDVTREERAKNYRETHDLLRPMYPSVKEKLAKRMEIHTK
jgi:hypothetical protein